MAPFMAIAPIHGYGPIPFMANSPTYVSLSHPQDCRHRHSWAIAYLGVTPARREVLGVQDILGAQTSKGAEDI